MSFGKAVSTCLTKYADFKGRARPSEYWWFLLFASAAEGALYAIARPLYFVAVLALLLPWIAVTVRRLHDTGRSGWYYFMILIPLAGPIIFVVYMASSGETGPNQYGDPV